MAGSLISNHHVAISFSTQLVCNSEKIPHVSLPDGVGEVITFADPPTRKCLLDFNYRQNAPDGD